MNRSFCHRLLLLCGVWAGSCLPAITAAEVDNVLARDGKACSVITLSPTASPAERHAAAELAFFLKQVTGAEFAIKSPAEAGDRPCLAVGPDAARALAPDLPLDGLGADGILLRSLPAAGGVRHLVLTGGPGAPRGTLYAVYTFLEDQVGCRWWTRSASTIPQKPTLSIPTALNVRYLPPLERRDQCFYEGMDKDWSVRMKFNGWCGPGKDEARGGSLDFAGPSCHTFYALVPPKEHFAQHPEWFSEINGKRTAEGGQLCLTNPELRQFVIGRVREWLRENPKAAYVSVTQNDWHGWCTCPACKAVDEAEGGQSGTMIQFANAVADAIAAEFPHAAVDTFAYEYTRKPPKVTKPRKNVVVRLCSIECDFAHPLEDDRNQAFREDIGNWAKICDRLYVWDYVTNFRHSLQAHPNLRVLGPNVRFFVRNHVKGLFEQGNYLSPGGEFGALRAWMLGRLLWNPASDDRALLAEFLAGYYGPAAPHLQRYINLIHDEVARTDFTMTCNAPSTAPYVAPAILDQAAALFEQARSAVADQPEYLRRLEIAELSLLYSRLEQTHNAVIQGNTVTDAPQFFAWLDRFETIAKREKVTRVAEGGEELGPWARRIRRVISGAGTEQTAWTAKIAGREVMVTRLSAFWKFASDPTDTGVAQAWFASTLDEASWKAQRNDLNCGWERQGFPGYLGFGWYRKTFSLPATPNQACLTLFFEAIDEEGWIYLNGAAKPAFEHTCAGTKLPPHEIWNTPFLFAAAGLLKPGQSNLLAVRVYNAGAMGGIWRPVYILASEAELTLQQAQEAVKQEPEKL